MESVSEGQKETIQYRGGIIITKVRQGVTSEEWEKDTGAF